MRLTPPYPRQLEPQVGSASWRAVFKQLFRTDTDNKCNSHHISPTAGAPGRLSVLAGRLQTAISNRYRQQMQFTPHIPDSWSPRSAQRLGGPSSNSYFNCGGAPERIFWVAAPFCCSLSWSALSVPKTNTLLSPLESKCQTLPQGGF
jgi:hypothetical protein